MRLSLLLLSMPLLSVVNADECTDAEAAYANSVWSTAAATSACAQYVTATDPVYIDAPCSATSCVSIVEGVAADLPDCTYTGINNKIEVQNALTACNGGDTADAGTLTTSVPVATTAATSAPSSSSTTDCTADEYQTTESLYNAVATSSACANYATSSSVLVTFDVPCSVTACIDEVLQLASSLPDCLYDGANKKQELTEGLTICTDNSGTTIDSTTPIASGSSSSTPASTASSTSCTNSEQNDMWDQYVATAKSDECSGDSTINGYSVYIFTNCDSTCANKIKELGDSLPNCFYDYELTNKKQEVLNEIDDCISDLSYISVSIYPDTSIDVSSTDGTSSGGLVSSDIPAANNTPAPGKGGNAQNGGSSASTTVQSGASTLDSTGVLRGVGLSTLLAIVGDIIL